MAIKKSAEAPKAAINIEQVADLFLQYNNEKKELEKKEKEMKEVLLSYAKDHAASFEGNTLKIGNTGVYVEKRAKLKSTYDATAIDMDWLDAFVEAGYGDMVEIKFNDKAVAENIPICKELEEIGYTLEVQDIYAVCTMK